MQKIKHLLFIVCFLQFTISIAQNTYSLTPMYGVNNYPSSKVKNKKGELILKELGYRTNIKDVLATSNNTFLSF